MIVLIKMGIAFFMSPIIVKALGNHDYGIWEMIISVIGYMGILDLGMTPAIVRYVARYNALDDNISLNKLYSTSLFFLGFIGIMSLFVFIFWAGVKPEILAENSSDSVRYSYMLVILGIQLLIKFPGLVAECFHIGFQRYNLRNNINISLTIISSLVLIKFLLNGYGLITLALISTLETFSKFIVYIILLSFKKYNNIVFKIKYISLKFLIDPLKFGYKSLINYISGILSISSDAIVIGVILGPISVTYYSIPAKLILILSGLLGAVTLSFMPFFSDLDARGNKAKAVQTMIIASKFVSGLMVPVLIVTCFLGIPFIKLWMGQEYAENGRLVLYILAGSFILNFVNPFHNHFLTGFGLHGLLARLNIYGAIVNIILSIAFVKHIGKEGAALGTLIASIIFSPIILSYTCKCLDITIWKYVKNVITILVIPNILLVVLLWAIGLNVDVNSYLKIIMIGVVSMSLYCIMFLTISLEKDERVYILSRIQWHDICK